MQKRRYHILIRIMLAVITLVGMIGLVACQTATRQPSPSTPTILVIQETESNPGRPQAPTPVETQMSTPALIDQALSLGEITAGQRLLYLTYAVYEYQSLPPQFQSNVGWRGTEFVSEIKEAANDPAVMCMFSQDVQNELGRLLIGVADCH